MNNLDIEKLQYCVKLANNMKTDVKCKHNIPSLKMHIYNYHWEICAEKPDIQKWLIEHFIMNNLHTFTIESHNEVRNFANGLGISVETKNVLIDNTGKKFKTLEQIKKDLETIQSNQSPYASM